jgi:heme exporter protein D
VSHDAFVFAAYGASILVLGGLAVWIIAGHRRAARDLAALEAAGIKRRSQS